MKQPDTLLPPILAVGTFVVDYQKVVDHYPEERSGTKVRKELVSNGGAPLNILINLAKLEVKFPLFAAAKVGKDLDGKYIIDCCQEHKIDTSQLVPVDDASTGYTDVYTVESTGKHTCFHFCGIGDTFSRRDVKLRAVKPKILLLGSLGALGKMDCHNPEYGRTGAAQLLRDARKQDITTVVEIAPIDQQAKIGDFTEALPFTDFLIINDRVAENLLSVELYSEGQFDPELARKACEMLLGYGLNKAVVIQSGSAAVYLGADGEFEHQSGYFLPWAQRVGSAGVDHAFISGFLEGMYHEKSVEVCLKQGLAVSTVCRCDLTPSGGISALEDCIAFCEALGA
ncbi:MAG: carbohydrate kinase family protein [Akkermansiaceae bacterium]